MMKPLSAPMEFELDSGGWTITIDDLKTFASLLEQRNSITNPHVDEAYAATQIYGGLFVDGNQVVTKFVHWITDQLPPGAVIDAPSKTKVKFINPSRPGDTLTFSGTVKFTEDFREARVDGRATSQSGKLVATIAVNTLVPAGQVGQAGGVAGRLVDGVGN